MTEPVDRLLIWWLRRGRYPWSHLRRWLFERGYLRKALPHVDSLEDVEACLKQLTWTMDGPWHLFDSISYPQTVWAKQKDDCDGFAILAAKLLAQWAPETNPVLVTAMVRPMRMSHTVCPFRQGDSLWYLDNYTSRKEDCQTYADIVAKIARGKRLVCWDVVAPDTLETLEFHVV